MTWDHLREIAGALDYWLARYQTLIVGLFAIGIAFRQMRIARSQAAINREQKKMNDQIQEQEAAIARLSCDQLLVKCMQAFQNAKERGNQTSNGQMQFMWEPQTVLVALDVPDWDEGAVAKQAVSAYGDDAPRFMALLGAVSEVKRIAELFQKNPWTIEDRDASLSNSALNGLFLAASGAATIQPHIRK